ncbi:MAG: hypothetical protein UW16_C0038G0003 [Microgenomates group bacterium GW2011_GWC1_44_10]|nr:MAG: hypothetical protein UW16_C0038G0003 [Microgenomates group bacterium GW2011_GWC1_44_10]
MVERLTMARMSGLISLPFSKNQRMFCAAVGKSGSQSALASSQVPWPKACWMGVGGVTWPPN